MALKILEGCIACCACVPPCPTNSISVADPIYVIDHETCTECTKMEEAIILSLGVSNDVIEAQIEHKESEDDKSNEKLKSKDN